MLIHFPVILSGAKACPERSRRDLIAACNRHEILRSAQDDNGFVPRAATKVSASNIFGRPKGVAATALTELTPAAKCLVVRPENDTICS
jgi:hypothetical protein